MRKHVSIKKSLIILLIICFSASCGSGLFGYNASYAYSSGNILIPTFPIDKDKYLTTEPPIPAPFYSPYSETKNEHIIDVSYQAAPFSLTQGVYEGQDIASEALRTLKLSKKNGCPMEYYDYPVYVYGPSPTTPDTYEWILVGTALKLDNSNDRADDDFYVSRDGYMLQKDSKKYLKFWVDDLMGDWSFVQAHFEKINTLLIKKQSVTWSYEEKRDGHLYHYYWEDRIATYTEDLFSGSDSDRAAENKSRMVLCRLKDIVDLCGARIGSIDEVGKAIKIYPADVPYIELERDESSPYNIFVKKKVVNGVEEVSEMAQVTYNVKFTTYNNLPTVCGTDFLTQDYMNISMYLPDGIGIGSGAKGFVNKDLPATVYSDGRWIDKVGVTHNNLLPGTIEVKKDGSGNKVSFTYTQKLTFKFSDGEKGAFDFRFLAVDSAGRPSHKHYEGDEEPAGKLFRILIFWAAAEVNPDNLDPLRGGYTAGTGDLQNKVSVKVNLPTSSTMPSLEEIDKATSKNDGITSFVQKFVGKNNYEAYGVVYYQLPKEQKIYEQSNIHVPAGEKYLIITKMFTTHSGSYRDKGCPPRDASEVSSAYCKIKYTKKDGTTGWIRNIRLPAVYLHENWNSTTCSCGEKCTYTAWYISSINHYFAAVVKMPADALDGSYQITGDSPRNRRYFAVDPNWWRDPGLDEAITVVTYTPLRQTFRRWELFDPDLQRDDPKNSVWQGYTR